MLGSQRTDGLAGGPLARALVNWGCPMGTTRRGFGRIDGASRGRRFGVVAASWALLAFVCSSAGAANAPSRVDVRDALVQMVAAGAPGVTAVIRGPSGV